MTDFQTQESPRHPEPDRAIPPPLDWPRLGGAALHGIAGDVVRSATENSEADPCAVLATFLTHAGVVIGRGPFIRVADSMHHGRLFNVLVGRSARGRKGTSGAAVRTIWDHAQPRVGYCAWKPGPLSSGEGLIYTVRDPHGEDPGVPDKRLFIVDGEYGAPLRALRRDGNTLSTTMRGAWDGTTLEPLTKNSPIIATDPHIGIVGHITEQELKSQLGHVEFFNGFANRHLWWCVRRSKHIALAEGLPKAEAERLGARYATQLIMARQLNEIVFSPSARRSYEVVYHKLMAEHEGFYGLVISRLEVQVIRVALIYACLDGQSEIGDDHLEAGLAVTSYCDASAKHLFGSLAIDPRETKILEALSKGEKSTTNLHHLLGGHCTSSELASLLAVLEAKGAITKASRKTGGRDLVFYILAKEAKEAK